MKKALVLTLVLTIFLTSTSIYSKNLESITINSVKNEMKYMKYNENVIISDEITPRGLNKNKKK